MNLSLATTGKRSLLQLSALCLATALTVGPAVGDPPKAADPQKNSPESADPMMLKMLAKRRDEPLSPEAKQAADKLKAHLTAGTEARLMLDAILSGNMMGPTDGWFSKAISQSRHRWADVSKKYDTDKDGKISRKEFPGTDADFARLDQNNDGSITEKDMNWKLDSLAATAANRFYSEADRDGDGKLSREEFNAMFDLWDKSGDGFISLDDLNRNLDPMNAPRRRSMPTKNQLVLGLARQEVGSHQPGPALGESAPDFQLAQVGTGKQVRLADLIGKKPVVLVFGNITCGPFRNQGGNIEKLYRRYHDRAEFLLVYVREAHPTDGWSMESNDKVGVSLAQPTTLESRTGVAARCQNMLKLSVPVVVDTLDDAVGARYSGMPSRLYVLDRSGKVAFKSGRGPFGFKPGECEQALIFQLAESTKQ